MKAAEKRQKEHERRAEKKVQKVAFIPAIMLFFSSLQCFERMDCGLLFRFMKNC